ncbi:MAG: hypothetical protein J6T10_23405 [Methanobrevibacter sp.]|nr:hypothetical protein [Methanobrevibacter sp.]
MTRKEENAEMINKIDTTFTGTKDEGMMFLFSIISSCMLDISKSLAIIATEEPDDKETLDYYTTTCTSCGKVAPVGDYCIWCGEKGTCLEGGDLEC